LCLYKEKLVAGIEEMVDIQAGRGHAEACIWHFPWDKLKQHFNFSC